MFVNKCIFLINIFLLLSKSADGINEYLFGITISLMISGMLQKHQIEQVYLKREEALAHLPLCGEPWPEHSNTDGCA